jgi:hypothetical protein
MSHHSRHERTSSTCDLTSAVRRSALRSHRCWRFRLSHPAHCRSAADQRPRPSAPHRNNAHPLRTVSSHETRSSLIATNPPATVMCLENRPERRQDPWDCAARPRTDSRSSRRVPSRDCARPTETTTGCARMTETASGQVRRDNTGRGVGLKTLLYIMFIIGI